MKTIYVNKRYVDRSLEKGTSSSSYSGSKSSATSVDLSKYYTKLESDSVFINADGDTMTGSLNMDASIVLNSFLSHIKLPTQSKILFGDNDTYIQEYSDDWLRIVTAGQDAMQFYGTYMWGGSGTTWMFNSVGVSSTVPSIMPAGSDPNTGLGWAGSDKLSLIAGGKEGLRIQPTVVKLDQLESLSTSFYRGFQGSGFGIYIDDASKYTIQSENGYFTDTFRAKTLEIGKVTSIGGSYVISDGNFTADSDLVYDLSAGLFGFTTNLYPQANSSDGFLSILYSPGYQSSIELWVEDTDYDSKTIYISNTEDFISDASTYQVTDVFVNNSFTVFYYTGSAFQIQPTGGSYQYAYSEELIETLNGKITVTFSSITTTSGFSIDLIEDSTSRVISSSANLIAGTTVYTLYSGEECLTARLRLKANSGILILNSVSPSFTVKSYPVTLSIINREFVKMADKEGTSIIYMTSSDESNPRIDLYADVSTFTLNQGNLKLRIGNRSGLLKTDGTVLGGYGLYGIDAYLTGEIESYKGIIAGWNLNNNKLSSTTDNGTVELNSEQTYISLYDENEIERIKLTTEGLSRPDQLIGANSLLYLDASCNNALFYVDVSTSKSSGTLNKYIYKSGSLVYDGTSDPGDSYHFDITDDKQYSFEYSIDASLVSLSATPEYDQIWGNWVLDITLRAYNDSDVILFEETKNYNDLGRGSYPITFKGSLGIADNRVYFRIFYKVSDNLWDSNGIIGLERKGNHRFYFDTTKIKLDGAEGKTLISSQGFVTAWDTDQYFIIDASTDNDLDTGSFIESAGTWQHNGEFRADGGVISDVKIITDNYTALATDEVIVFNGTASKSLYIPTTAAIGKKYVIVNATTSYALNIFSGGTDGQILRGGGNSSVAYGTNAFSSSVPYTLTYMRTMEIIKIKQESPGGYWSWLRY